MVNIVHKVDRSLPLSAAAGTAETLFAKQDASFREPKRRNATISLPLEVKLANYAARTLQCLPCSEL